MNFLYNFHSNNILIDKLQIVRELHRSLTTGSISPETRLRDYYAKLIDATQCITLHRDPVWKRYAANAMRIIAIILTGIIPGLILLSQSRFAFWQPKGAAFIDAIKKIKIQRNSNLCS